MGSLEVEVRVNKFGLIASRLSGVVAHHLDDAVDRVVTRAQEIAPVDTGFMRDHIHAEGDPGSLDRSIVSEADYSAFVEFGTIHMQAEPFLGPALDEAVNGLIDRALGIEAELTR